MAVRAEKEKGPKVEILWSQPGNLNAPHKEGTPFYRYYVLCVETGVSTLVATAGPAIMKVDKYHGEEYAIYVTAVSDRSGEDDAIPLPFVATTAEQANDRAVIYLAALFTTEGGVVLPHKEVLFATALGAQRTMLKISGQLLNLQLRVSAIVSRAIEAYENGSPVLEVSGVGSIPIMRKTERIPLNERVEISKTARANTIAEIEQTTGFTIKEIMGFKKPVAKSAKALEID